MMRLSILLLLFSTMLSAQSAILKDPDIVWAAEIEQDWVVDIPSLEEEWNQGIITLKQVRSRENELHWSSPYLAELVFEAVRRGDLTIFKDSDCKEKLNIRGMEPEMVTLVNFNWPNLNHDEKNRQSDKTKELIWGQLVDTMVTFDPLTFEEQILAIQHQPEPFSDVVAWRLRQVLAYHKKSARWSTEVVGIAPLVKAKNWDSGTEVLQPAFWFKPDNKRQKLNSNRIVWAKKTFSDKQSQTQVPYNPTTIIKRTTGFENPMSHLLSVFQSHKKSPFYDSQGGKILSLEQRKSMMQRIDTSVYYNWETHEGTIVVENKGISDSMIQQLRLAQTWYWDDRRARLSICLDAVAPLEEVVYPQYSRENGGIQYPRPLFYRMAKR